MSNIPRFAAYAAAFEQAYESNQWSGVEAYLSEDVVYEIGLPIFGATRREGRSEVVAWFSDVLDRWDRRFDSRELTLLDGPRAQQDEVWIFGSATYKAAGVPDFVLELEETVSFSGDLIVRLEDRYTSQMEADVNAFVSRYGDQIGLEWDRSVGS